MTDSHAGHSHGPISTHGAAQRRALWISLALNGGFMGAEIVGGVLFGSLALLADAAHMGSDVVGLVIALVAARLVQRPASGGHTYGWRRAEALGAQANAATLLAVAAWVLVEAQRRINNPHPVEGGPVLLIAVLGLAVNVASAVLLARAAQGNLNMRGAFVHMVADAAGSVGVIAAAIIVLTTGATWADPVISMLLAVLIAWSALGLLRATTRVLLEAAPDGLEPDDVAATLLAAIQVTDVHHLHVWTVSSDQSALSAHVVLDGEPSLRDAQATGEDLKALLARHHDIHHATLELECHPCPHPESACERPTRLHMRTK